MVRLTCERAGCVYRTADKEGVTVQQAINMMKLHTTQAHPATRGAKPEKVHQPMDTMEITMSDWLYFHQRWTGYKVACHLNGKDIQFQLMECCNTVLH
jgi:hypothetical protein